MIARLIAATIFAVLCACAYAALVHAPAEKHPLLITTSACAAGPNPCDRIRCEVKPDTRRIA